MVYMIELCFSVLNGKVQESFGGILAVGIALWWTDFAVLKYVNYFKISVLLVIGLLEDFVKRGIERTP